MCRWYAKSQIRDFNFLSSLEISMMLRNLFIDFFFLEICKVFVENVEGEDN